MPSRPRRRRSAAEPAAWWLRRIADPTGTSTALGALHEPESRKSFELGGATLEELRYVWRPPLT
jgi:hypothetical protein